MPTVHCFSLHLIDALILVDLEDELKLWLLLVSDLVAVVDEVPNSVSRLHWYNSMEAVKPQVIKVGREYRILRKTI